LRCDGRKHPRIQRGVPESFHRWDPPRRVCGRSCRAAWTTSFGLDCQGGANTSCDWHPAECAERGKRPVGPPRRTKVLEQSLGIDREKDSCGIGPSKGRSEEHTSELQSRENLVCRLLLEKKKH